MLSAQHRRERRAMRISLLVGVAMLGIKWLAYLFTGSAAIFSDAIESVVHNIAILFASFSLKLSHRPPDQRFRYGYERISFFSAGFEGAMIALAAGCILWAAVDRLLHGIQLQRLGAGVLITGAVCVVNGLLGWYIVRTGRQTQSIILQANGKHVLTDGWTSFGVIAGLGLVALTGWKVLDPVVAILIALNILWSGYVLMRKSIGGLMDYADPATSELLRASLDELCTAQHVQYHRLRFRDTGMRLIVEVHLLLPYGTPLGEAHRLATRLEELLPDRVGRDVELVTHLEALEDHAQVHARTHPF